MIQSAPRPRVPWMQIDVEASAAGGVSRVHVTCVHCGAFTSADVDEREQYIGKVAMGLSHAEQCPVPPRMAKARAARWN